VEMAAEVSDFAVVDEVAEVYPGMMVAVPPADWPRLASRGAAEVARVLNELAERVPVWRMGLLNNNLNQLGLETIRKRGPDPEKQGFQ